MKCNNRFCQGRDIIKASHRHCVCNGLLSIAKFVANIHNMKTKKKKGGHRPEGCITDRRNKRMKETNGRQR